MKFDLKTLITETELKVLILSAGMLRSGSTWLYNAARLLLLNSTLTCSITSYGWIHDLPSVEKKRIMLIKMHMFDENMLGLEVPKIVLYSFRDIRDVLASIKRMWGREPSFEDAGKYIHLDSLWRMHADFILRYESMIVNPAVALAELASFLNIQDVNVNEVIAQIDKLSYDNPGAKDEKYHTENLLHKGHFTDGRHGSWKGVVDAALIKTIENEYRGWFTQNDYPLTI